MDLTHGHIKAVCLFCVCLAQSVDESILYLFDKSYLTGALSLPFIRDLKQSDLF